MGEPAEDWLEGGQKALEKFESLEPEVANVPPVDPIEGIVEIPVGVFEGEYVRKMVGKIPALQIDMPVGYPRNTHLKFEVELRVKNVSMIEERKSGDLQRVHELSWEDFDIKLVGAFTADQLDPGVGGSASVSNYHDEDNDDDGF